MPLRPYLAVTLLCAVLLPACSGPAGTQAPAGDPGRGQSLFTGEARPPCATCHTIQGVSTGQIGPDLTHIGSEAANRVGDPAYTGSAKDAAGYLHESIVMPNAFLAPKCPAGACFKDIMPQNFGEALTEQQASDLVAFLLEQQ